jgi:hypothetical protein
VVQQFVAAAPGVRWPFDDMCYGAWTDSVHGHYDVDRCNQAQFCLAFKAWPNDVLVTDHDTMFQQFKEGDDVEVMITLDLFALQNLAAICQALLERHKTGRLPGYLEAARREAK